MKNTPFNKLTFVSTVGIVLAIVTAYFAWQANQQTQEQLDIAKQQIAVPQFVEAIKLLERKDSFFLQKSAIKMLENLATSNQQYTQQIIDILLPLNEWMGKKIKNEDYQYFSDFLHKKTKNNQERVSQEVLKSIARIITHKNVQELNELDLDNANLCGIELYNFQPKTIIKLNLSHACLIGSNLTNINFKNTNLSGADFRNAKLENIDFSNNKSVNNAIFFCTKKIKIGTKKYNTTCESWEENFDTMHMHRIEMGMPSYSKVISECTKNKDLMGFKIIHQVKLVNEINFSGVDLDSSVFGYDISYNDKGIDLSEIKFIGNNPCKQKTRDEK